MAGVDGTRRALLAAAISSLSSAHALAGASKVVRVLDCCGSFQLTLRAFEAFRHARGSAAPRFVFAEAPAAKLSERVRPSVEPGFDLVLAGPDALIDGIDEGLWLRLLPDHAERLPDVERVLSSAAWQMQGMARGYGVVTAFSPIGPLVNYVAARVPSVPGTMSELLDWALTHRTRFSYANPALSDGGRAFLMSLPYALGDADPKDPERGWSKTWSALQELATSIERYPVTSAASLLELQAGTLDVCVSSLADDIAARMSPVSDPHSELMDLRGCHWVGSAYYAAIPRNVAVDTVPILLDLIGFLLTPEAQAFAYDRGRFYPGPAVMGVGLDAAPPASRQLVGSAERALYSRLIADHPVETPLAPAALKYVIRRWTTQIARAG